MHVRRKLHSTGLLFCASSSTVTNGLLFRFGLHSRYDGEVYVSCFALTRTYLQPTVTSSIRQAGDNLDRFLTIKPTKSLIKALYLVQAQQLPLLLPMVPQRRLKA